MSRSRVRLLLAVCGMLSAAGLFSAAYVMGSGRVARARTLMEECNALLVLPGAALKASDPPGARWLRLLIWSPEWIDFSPKSMEHMRIASRWHGMSSLVMLPGPELRDADLAPLSAMDGLTYLYVGGGNLDGSFLKYLPRPDLLDALSLPCTEFRDANAPLILRMTRLRSLEVRSTPFSDEGLQAMRGVRGLVRLDLTGTRITGASLPVICGFRKLEFLSIAGTRVDGSHLAELSSLGSLQKLYLHGISTRADDLRPLAGLPNLADLGCDLETSELSAALTVFAAMANLGQLNVTVTDEPPASVREQYREALGCEVSFSVGDP